MPTAHNEEGETATSENRGRWLLIAHPDGEGDLTMPPVALAAAPAAVRDARRGVVVRDPYKGRCRLCGRTDRMTREHVPPASAQVGGPVVVHTVEEWLARSRAGAVPGGTAQQGGTWTRGLCASCNTTTGSWYGEEYRRWVGRAMGVLQQLPPLAEMDAQDHVGAVRVRFGDVDPGAFVRQVLSLMCTVSGPWDLAGAHPEVRAMVLNRQAGSLPDGMGLYLTLYCGPPARILGPSLVIDRPTGRWQWLLEVAHPPLATVLTLAGDAAPPPLLDISQFTTVAPGTRLDYEADIAVGVRAHADAGRLPPRRSRRGPGWSRPAGIAHRGAPDWPPASVGKAFGQGQAPWSGGECGRHRSGTGR